MSKYKYTDEIVVDCLPDLVHVVNTNCSTISKWINGLQSSINSNSKWIAALAIFGVVSYAKSSSRIRELEERLARMEDEQLGEQSHSDVYGESRAYANTQTDDKIRNVTRRIRRGVARTISDIIVGEDGKR